MHSLFDPANQHRDVRSLSTPVGVQFIEDEEVQTLRRPYDFSVNVRWPSHHKFEHHEVRQQDVRRGVGERLSLFRSFLPGVLRDCLEII